MERIKFNKTAEKVQLQWRDSTTTQKLQSSSYDYAIIAVPFSVLRKWRMPKPLPLVLTNAIAELNYDNACKVALEFSTRFWEHYENPIYGSCSTSTDIPGIGQICYPSYNINGTGPASILASFTFGVFSNHWISVSEEDHVQYVLEAMIEIHGEEIRELYTGKYRRKCWLEDPYASGAWASPIAGQHELYMPEYFKTHNNVSKVQEDLSLYTFLHLAT